MKTITIYTDGSFRNGNDFAAWAFVLLDGESILKHGAGLTAYPALSRNIDGELQAVINALHAARRYIRDNAITVDQLDIYYDYAGIEKWVTGEWNAASEVSLNYVQTMGRLFCKVPPIIWHKVKGHSGNKWNDFVDRLASVAVRSKK